jgi:ABC-type bacteriocin/lantibiotic exporter with double-glycine peptidase domain
MILLPVSHRRQKQQADCLAACAAMALGYLQVPINYEDVNRLLGVDAIGTPFRRLQNLQALGLRINIDEGNLTKLQTYLEDGLPSIAAVNTGQLPYWEDITNHAVVIIGIDEQYVYLNDPDTAESPQVVSLAEFELAWLEKDYLFAVIELE